MTPPKPSEIKALRESVQAAQGCGSIRAIDHCADALHVPRRTWQRWEAGERAMHPAFWELAQIKLTPPAPL